jgi:hypothetical protein
VSSATSSQLTGLVITAAIMCLVIWRRMRPQQVGPVRIAISGVIIVLVVAAGFAGTGGALMRDVPALVVAPIFLAAGIALGFLLVRTLSLWTDPDSGEPWMRGGPLFAVILVGTIALRMGARLVTTGSVYGGSPTSVAPAHSLLYTLSGDLLLLTLGLWAARAFFLLKRLREHQQETGAAAEERGRAPSGGG